MATRDDVYRNSDSVEFPSFSGLISEGSAAVDPAVNHLSEREDLLRDARRVPADGVVGVSGVMSDTSLDDAALVEDYPMGRSDLTEDFDVFYEQVSQEWQEQALCAQTDPEAFFPEKGGSTREAKRICRACVVRDECLEYALEHDERFGIWGGLSERERRRVKKRLS